MTPQEPEDEGCAPLITGFLFVLAMILAFSFGALFESGHCK